MGGKGKARRDYHDLGPSEWSLTFDTESTRDPGQRLRVGAFQQRRRERLVREGLFYDPDALDASEIELVHEYANRRGIKAMTRDEFAHRVFMPLVHRHRALLLAHNGPFDIFRIALDHGPARGRDKSMRGGYWVQLSRDPDAPASRSSESIPAPPSSS